MRPGHWAVVARIATAQDGLITGPQVRAAGASRASFDRDVRFGRLTPVRRKVYRVAGVKAGPHEAVWAVVLASPRLVPSHMTAAALWGLMDLRAPLHFTAPPESRIRPAGVVVHRSLVARHELTEAGGIPVTTPARTIVDLASVLAPDWVERLLHDVVMRRLCEYDDVAAAIDGRRGPAFLRAALADVGTTPIERQWSRRLREAGLPRPVAQHQVVVGGRVYVLDFAWPEARVALEVDGFVAHRTRAAFDRDRAKVLALQAAGWHVVSVTARTPVGPALASLRALLTSSASAVDAQRGS